MVWFLSMLLSAHATERLAVLELGGSSLKAEERGLLTDTVRGAVVSSVGQDIQVMTRENMEVMLTDMGLDASCVAEGACEVETARNLGVDYVVSGQIVGMGSLLVASLKLHETDSGRLLASVQVRGADAVALLDGLSDPSVELVATLAGAPAPAPAPASAPMPSPLGPGVGVGPSPVAAVPASEGLTMGSPEEYQASIACMSRRDWTFGKSFGPMEEWYPPVLPPQGAREWSDESWLGRRAWSLFWKATQCPQSMGPHDLEAARRLAAALRGEGGAKNPANVVAQHLFVLDLLVENLESPDVAACDVPVLEGIDFDDPTGFEQIPASGKRLTLDSGASLEYGSKSDRLASARRLAACGDYYSAKDVFFIYDKRVLRYALFVGMAARKERE